MKRLDNSLMRWLAFKTVSSLLENEKIPDESENVRIEDIKKIFSEYIKALDALKENPQRFYPEEPSKREVLLCACKNMRDFYSKLVDEEDARAREAKGY